MGKVNVAIINARNDDKKITVVPRLTDSEDFEDCDTATLGMIRPSGVEMELTDGQLSALRDKIINKNNQNILTCCNIPELTDTEDSSD